MHSLQWFVLTQLGLRMDMCMCVCVCVCVCVRAMWVCKCSEDVCVYFGMYVCCYLQECINILLFVDHFVPKTSGTLMSFHRHALGVGASEIWHGRYHSLLGSQAWKHSEQIWYQKNQKKLGYKMILFILIFRAYILNKRWFSKCQVFFYSHGICFQIYGMYKKWDSFSHISMYFILTRSRVTRPQMPRHGALAIYWKTSLTSPTSPCVWRTFVPTRYDNL